MSGTVVIWESNHVSVCKLIGSGYMGIQSRISLGQW